MLEISPNALSLANEIADFTVVSGQTFVHLIPILHLGIAIMTIFIAF